MDNYMGLKGRTVMAHMHSMGGNQASVKIISATDCNNVVAEYNGKQYTAVYNGFVGSVYVDDTYGELH